MAHDQVDQVALVHSLLENLYRSPPHRMEMLSKLHFSILNAGNSEQFAFLLSFATLKNIILILSDHQKLSC